MEMTLDQLCSMDMLPRCRGMPFMLHRRPRENIGEAQPQRFKIEPLDHSLGHLATLGISHTVPYNPWILEALEIVNMWDIHFSVANDDRMGRATKTPGLGEMEGHRSLGLSPDPCTQRWLPPILSPREPHSAFLTVKPGPP